MTPTPLSASRPTTPLLRLPGPTAHSVRRTTSHDTYRGDNGADARVEASGHDVVTGDAGAATVADRVRVRARVDTGSRHLRRLSAEPDEPALEDLVGVSVGRGFRSALVKALPDHVADRSVLHSLLDDLPGAVLVSGYAGLRDGAPQPDVAVLEAKFDQCAGWAADATMPLAIRRTGRTPVPLGPVAPALDEASVPLAWQALPRLSPGWMRRRRLLDLAAPVASEPGRRVQVVFRDSHVDDAGVETVLHEYAVELTVDDEVSVILALEVTSTVLPWMECPRAVASAQRYVGAPLDGLRRRVPREMIGITTCTHLNDVLRTLEDLPRLGRLLANQAG